MGKRIPQQQAIGVGKEQDVAAGLPRPRVPGFGRTRMALQANELAGEALYHLKRIIHRTIIDHDDLEVAVVRGIDGLEALADCFAPVVIGDDD